MELFIDFTSVWCCSVCEICHKDGGRFPYHSQLHRFIIVKNRYSLENPFFTLELTLEDGPSKFSSKLRSLSGSDIGLDEVAPIAHMCSR